MSAVQAEDTTAGEPSISVLFYFSFIFINPPLYRVK